MKNHWFSEYFYIINFGSWIRNIININYVWRQGQRDTIEVLPERQGFQWANKDVDVVGIKYAQRLF